MKKLIFLFLLLKTMLPAAQAQVQPPDFLCVRGDTLYWEIPSNNCGAFNSYDIFFSANPGGPFSPLASVTTPAQDFFFHVNPSGQIWYYYLVSNFNCPGQPAPSSDTLDNQPPEVSSLRSVSVENGDVLLNWQPSPSPEVFAYIIYRQTSIGVIPIDTVFGGTTFTDLNASPETQSEGYFVNALDRCGTTSIFDAKHSTMFLESSLDACDQTVSLTWNLYQNWHNGIGEHEIWVGVNGAAPTLTVTIAGSAGTFDFKNLNDGDTYCFFVQAIESGTGEASKSNQVCLTAEVTQPTSTFFIKNVSVTPAGEVEVTWIWNTNAEINEMQVLRSNENGNYQPIFVQEPQFPLVAENTYTDAAADPGAGKVFYQIQTKDDCDSLALSTYGSTIHLAAAAQPDNVNFLNWTAFDLQNATVTSYEIYKILNGTETKIATPTSQTLDYADPFDPANLAEAEACYYVVAKADLATPTGGTLSIRSRSNIVCVEQEVRILTPNAFAPRGFNQEFKPLIVLGNVASYDLRIFNRYGQELFHSTSPDDGWNGKKGAQDMPQGVYAFQIRVTQASGKTAEKRGVVLLLR